MSKVELNRYLDHAVLKPEMTLKEVRDAIRLGIEYKVKTVCVRPCDIDLAVEMCRGTETEVSCVLGFPHGVGLSEIKAEEAKAYIRKGVREIDMVVNYSYIRSGEWELVEKDIKAVSNVTKPAGILLKVIFETSELALDEIAKATEVSIKADADFVKTSTGFSRGGATVEAVETMLNAGKGRIRVKPSGGIRDEQTALKYVDMGADRLGVGYSSTPVICGGSPDTGNKSGY